jgi:hypothetical protein
MKTKEFYRELKKCFKKSIHVRKMCDNLNYLVYRYKDKPICKYVNKKIYGEIYHNPPVELLTLCDVGKNYPLVILMFMANKFVNYNDDCTSIFEIMNLFMKEDDIVRNLVEGPLRNETHTLFKRGIVEFKSVEEKNVGAGQQNGSGVLHLTDTAKREMFGIS